MGYCHSGGFSISILIGKFVGQPYTIKGDSMDPTLKDGERVVVNIMGYKIGDVKKVTSSFSMLTRKIIT